MKRLLKLISDLDKLQIKPALEFILAALELILAEFEFLLATLEEIL